MAIGLSDLTLFLTVAEQGSLSRAATSTHQAQPSVSARISGMERTLGVRLFERTTRGVVLTPAGKAFAPYARRCLEAADEGRLAAQASAETRRFVVLAPASIADGVFPDLVETLAHQPCQVVCRAAHSHEITRQLLDGVAHIGLVTTDSAPRGLALRPFSTSPIRWVAARHHPLRTRGAIRLADLTEQRLAVHTWGAEADQLATLLDRARVPRSHVSWVSPASVATTLARDFGHVAALAVDHVRAEFDAGSLKELPMQGLPHWNATVNIAYVTGTDTDPLIRAVLGHPH
ncbi:MAG TPA: LysR family transcriptional regulator [Flexivirga sp.]|uniref:LysR family transcriptional regulator n=1 Tax=Flexivirga sp. TaxID=1962927 RepID=UPI002BA0E3F5|nr:LysR family transcriptional regulator [Flexivirga sp.]HWC23033.1 LysR family transcriptional regulator [Flexivirga sp.]